MRILVNTPMKLQNEENNYNARPSYCNASSINEVKSNKKSTTFCRKLDGLFLNWPVESRAVTLATYIKEKWQRATDCAAGLVYDPENPVRFEDLRHSFSFFVIYNFNILFLFIVFFQPKKVYSTSVKKKYPFRLILLAVYFNLCKSRKVCH